jgi:hypothetical protein
MILDIADESVASAGLTAAELKRELATGRQAVRTF